MNSTNEDGLDIVSKQIQMKKGLLEFSILLTISQRKVYASEIIDEMRKADLIVVEGTLYPILSRIKNAQLIHYEWVESESGPPRKYYTLTEKGRETLLKLRETWEQLSRSVHKLEQK
jgi:PadR family transcriptional regulator, regulatory protein PadR